jgi:uncharacterized lipoprotein YddW (UPF0748 family)
MTKALLCGCVVALLAVPAGGAERTEHRGIWLHPDQFKTPALADAWIEKIAAAHLNAVYPLVWYRGGTAWFKSRLSPMGADAAAGAFVKQMLTRFGAVAKTTGRYFHDVRIVSLTSTTN